MKKLLFLFLLFSVNLNAQNRFSKLYNSEERAADLSAEVQVLSDGYMFCSTSAGGKSLKPGGNGLFLERSGSNRASPRLAHTSGPEPD